ncbi:MAG: dipeptide epimerase [Proteobacteria bacterium]|nr:dipeptide epimerase [Pseudomonadota bacterium]
MPRRKLHIAVEQLRFVAPFRISGYVFEKQDAVIVTLEEGAHRGRGEAAGVYYLGDTSQSLVATIEGCRAEIESGIDRAGLQELMPAGGARNAVDCALWDLDAKRGGRSVLALACMPPVRPLVTTFTLGAEAPETMAAGARRFVGARSLKLKLTGELDLDLARVDAVRAACPDAWLGVDANRGYAIGDVDALVRGLVAARVSLLEQPLQRGSEADLEGYVSPIPIAADESALTLADTAGLVGRFDVVNIKLDKCGGLTEGLAIAREARRLGLGVMVGNMCGTSLSMAPAFVLGQICDYVDLDGPLLIANDPEPRARYADGTIWCGPEIWG